MVLVLPPASSSYCARRPARRSLGSKGIEKGLLMKHLLVATVSMFVIGVGAAAEAQTQRTPLGDQWQRDIEVRQQVDLTIRNGPRADGTSPAADVGFFYDELSPYGEWVQHPDFGWVWFPRDVGPSWRPYTLGRWVFTDYGWTWVSEERFGWATYHYGRWLADPQIGWIWVPGTDWAPAWVAWQEAAGFIGWAPLPPSVGFDRETGLQTAGLDTSFGISPLDYSFVDERRFLSSRIGGYLLPAARNFTIMRSSASATSYLVVDHHVINRGVPIETIERSTGTRRPTRFRVAVVAEPGNAGVRRDVVSIYRPRDGSLQTVRVAPRNNAGVSPRREFSIRLADGTLASRLPLPRILPGAEMPVAPRTEAAGNDDEQRFRREQSELRSSQGRDEQALDAIHHQEMAQWQSRAETQVTSKRGAAEAQSLRNQQRGAQQQLQKRQQIQVESARAGVATKERKVIPPTSPATTKPTRDKGANPPRR